MISKKLELGLNSDAKASLSEVSMFSKKWAALLPRSKLGCLLFPAYLIKSERLTGIEKFAEQAGSLRPFVVRSSQEE